MRQQYSFTLGSFVDISYRNPTTRLTERTRYLLAKLQLPVVAATCPWKWIEARHMGEIPEEICYPTDCRILFVHGGEQFDKFGQ
jgi:hypothetical protein